MKTFYYFVQRFGISDVCRSAAETNMGEGFEKARIVCPVLADVHFTLGHD